MRFSTLKISWRNLGRNKRRTLLALSAIGIGQLALLATNSLMHGYADNIRLAITGPMVGHVQVHHPGWREERASDLAIGSVSAVLGELREDSAVRNAGARIYAPVLAAPEQDAFTAVVVGVEIGVESEAYGLLSGMEERLRPRHVLVGYRLARKMGISPGIELAVVGQGADGSLANDLFTVQDIIRSPADLVNQLGVVMGLEEAQVLLALEDQAHEIVIRTVRSGEAEALADRLRGNEVCGDLEMLTWKEVVPELVAVLDMSDYVGYIILALVFVAATAGIANTLMMSTFERMHEFGMLLALGARPQRVVRMIVIEALVLGVLGVVAGTLLGYVFVAVFSGPGIDIASWGGSGEAGEMAYKGLNLPLHVYPRLEVGDSLMGLIAVLVTSLIASIWPAWVAGRLEPVEAMRS